MRCLPIGFKHGKHLYSTKQRSPRNESYRQSRSRNVWQSDVGIGIAKYYVSKGSAMHITGWCHQQQLDKAKV
jgi:hypothetical protein